MSAYNSKTTQHAAPVYFVYTTLGCRVYSIVSMSYESQWRKPNVAAYFLALFATKNVVFHEHKSTMCEAPDSSSTSRPMWRSILFL